MKNIKPKVAFFMPSLEPGGTERNVVNLVNNIDREKYVISLVLGKMEGDFIKNVKGDIQIIDLKVSGSFRLLLKLVAYLKNQKPDIFISAFPRINIISITARMFVRVKTRVIITEHSVFSLLPVIAKTSWRRLFSLFFMPILGKYIYPKASSIICVSRGIAEDISNMIKTHDNIKVIYNPIIDDAIYQSMKQPIDHVWFSDSKIPVILAAGRLTRSKDYPTLLKAFELVIKKQPAHLVILGRGPEQEKLVRLSNDLGLSKHVAFLGFQDNPYSYMKRSSVFVLSSLQEGFGNVIIEAMFCGTPVISTDCITGPKEIITSGENGILVPVGDAESLAKAILSLLNDPLLREKFSQEGKKRSQDFSIKSSVEKYQQVFDEVLHNSNSIL